MPANKYALLRYRIIDKTIRNKYKPYPSKEDLRLACEEALYNSNHERISDSTIEKDLYAMRNEEGLGFFAPIKFSREFQGYFYEDPEYSIDDLPLNDEDVEAIKFAATTLSQFKHLEIFNQFGSAIDKIMGRVSISADLKNESLGEFIQFENTPTAKGTDHIPTILEAIRTKNQVLMTYKSFLVGIENVRTFHPYLLKEFRSRWYTIGLDTKDHKIKTFALDRISEVKLKDEPFKVQPDFDVEEFFRYTYGITSTSEKPEKIILQFDAQQSNYIRTQPLHSSQQVIKDDDGLKIELTLHITPELVMQLLSFGPHVTVIRPQILKQKIQSELRSALENYD
jgi:predicted DNA-binding transcriptional regulator YafY